MSRTKKGTKAPGWEPWSRRGNKTKRVTHGIERREGKAEVEATLREGSLPPLYALCPVCRRVWPVGDGGVFPNHLSETLAPVLSGELKRRNVHCHGSGCRPRRQD